jgi:hypothetical protein
MWPPTGPYWIQKTPERGEGPNKAKQGNNCGRMASHRPTLDTGNSLNEAEVPVDRLALAARWPQTGPYWIQKITWGEEAKEQKHCFARLPRKWGRWSRPSVPGGSCRWCKGAAPLSCWCARSPCT